MATFNKSEKLTILSVLSALEKKNIAVFTGQEFRRLFSLSHSQAKYFLETYAHREIFIRLKRGLYGVARSLPCDEELANSIYRPSYLSFEYALSKYSIIPEAVYTLTSATTMPAKTLSANGRTFAYHAIQKEAFAGYRLMVEGGRRFLIAEPEKALVDYLYFVATGKKSINDRIDCRRLDRDALIRYARLFKRPALNHLVHTVCSPKQP